MLEVRRLLLPLLASTVLVGCGGQSCDGLADLRAERNAARQEQLERVEPGSDVSEADKAEADDALHELEGRVFRLEQECANR